MYMANISETLKGLRLDRGMTQEEVAEQVGLTRQAVSSYESGRTQPGLDILERLAQVYEVELTDIVYGRSKDVQLRKALKITAIAAAAVILAAQLLEAVLLWTTDRLFPLEPGVLTEAEKVILETRMKMEAVWSAVGGFWYSLFPLFCIAILVLLICQRRPVPARTKLLCSLGFAAASMVVVLPWALTDPVFSHVNYLTMPVLALIRLAFFLVVSLVIDFFRGRKGRKAKAESVE